MPVRYSPVNQALHWFSALLMFAVLPVGWVMSLMDEESARFLFWLGVHKTIGLLILFLTVLRIAWRLHDRPPALPRGIPPWNRGLAHTAYGLLLLAMVAMPVSGYLWTNGHGFDVEMFGLVTMPRFAWQDKPVGDFGKLLHLWGQWLVYGLIVLHLAGVVFHILFRADGLLGRMLPKNAIEPRDEGA